MESNKEPADQYLALSLLTLAEFVIFFFFGHGLVYTTQGLLATDGVQLSQRGKRIFFQELAGLIELALS